MSVLCAQVFEFSAADLQDEGVIGSGNFAVVSAMRHRTSGVRMAVKRIRVTATIDDTCASLSLLCLLPLVATTMALDSWPWTLDVGLGSSRVLSFNQVLVQVLAER